MPARRKTAATEATTPAPSSADSGGGGGGGAAKKRQTQPKTTGTAARAKTTTKTGAKARNPVAKTGYPTCPACKTPVKTKYVSWTTDDLFGDARVVHHHRYIEMPKCVRLSKPTRRYIGPFGFSTPRMPQLPSAKNARRPYARAPYFFDEVKGCIEYNWRCREPCATWYHFGDRGKSQAVLGKAASTDS